ncbi:MAG: hypothetical protein Q9163_005691 [Psora crenata]
MSVFLALLIYMTSLFQISDCSPTPWVDGSDLPADSLDAIIAGPPNSGSAGRQSAPIPYASLESLFSRSIVAATSPLSEPDNPQGTMVGSSVRSSDFTAPCGSTGVLPRQTRWATSRHDTVSGSSPPGSISFKPYPSEGAPYQNKSRGYSSPLALSTISVPSLSPNTVLNASQPGISNSLQRSGLNNQHPPPRTVTQPPLTVTLPAETVTATQPASTVTLPAETVTATQPASTVTLPAETVTATQPASTVTLPAETMTATQPASTVTLPAETVTATQPASTITLPAETVTATVPLLAETVTVTAPPRIQNIFSPTLITMAYVPVTITTSQGASCTTASEGGSLLHNTSQTSSLSAASGSPAPDLPSIGGSQQPAISPNETAPELPSVGGSQQPAIFPIGTRPISRPNPQPVQNFQPTKSVSGQPQPIITPPVLPQSLYSLQRPPSAPSALPSATPPYGNSTRMNSSTLIGSGASTGLVPTACCRTDSARGSNVPIDFLRPIGTGASQRFPLIGNGSLVGIVPVTELSSISRLTIPSSGSMQFAAKASNMTPTETDTGLSEALALSQSVATTTEIPANLSAVQPSPALETDAPSTSSAGTSLASTSRSQFSAAPQSSPTCFTNHTSFQSMTANYDDLITFHDRLPPAPKPRSLSSTSLVLDPPPFRVRTYHGLTYTNFTLLDSSIAASSPTILVAEASSEENLIVPAAPYTVFDIDEVWVACIDNRDGGHDDSDSDDDDDDDDEGPGYGGSTSEGSASQKKEKTKKRRMLMRGGGGGGVAGGNTPEEGNCTVYLTANQVPAPGGAANGLVRTVEVPARRDDGNQEGGMQLVRFQGWTGLGRMTISARRGGKSVRVGIDGLAYTLVREC